MDASLQQESELLARSWMRHESAMLRDYLVADVEDPRLNLQSILTRHFLVSRLYGERFRELADAELYFGIAMNWLLATAKKACHAEVLSDIAYGLQQGADTAEGFIFPPFVRTLFASFPKSINGETVSNYIREGLLETRYCEREPVLPQRILDTFQWLWTRALNGETPQTLTVLEPACGSANDYRFLERYGIARLLAYTGMDLCEKNILNARELFPKSDFKIGNVFEIAAPNESFDCTYVHDLFEHLSPEGIEKAVREICRVTRKSLCLHFFNLEEIPEDIIRPVDNYHWNTLGMERMQNRFAVQGFSGHIMNIGQFQRFQANYEETHNPCAYTFFLERKSRR